MAFKIEFTHLAEADLDGILAWLMERQAGQAGLRWFEGLQAAVSTLSDMPQRCPMFKDPRVDFEVRQLFYGKKQNVFRITFHILGDTVYVLRIRRGKEHSDPSDTERAATTRSSAGRDTSSSRTAPTSLPQSPYAQRRPMSTTASFGPDPAGR